MVAVIIGSLVFIVGILILISCAKYGDDFAGVGILAIVGSAVIIVISLCTGKSIYKQDNIKLLEEKENIEYLLENKPSLYNIKEAENYNSNVDIGNNYFCRFSKEDRSEFKIDIDKYISGDNNE